MFESHIEKTILLYHGNTLYSSLYLSYNVHVRIHMTVEKSLLLSTALSSIILLLYFLLPYDSFLKQYIFVVLIVLFSYPLLMVCISTRKLKLFVSELILLAVIGYIVTYYFDKILMIFPPSIIGSSSVIGYAQFSGYPFYLDNFIFNVLLFHPVILFIIFVLIDKKRKRKT